MNPKESGRRRFLKNGAALAGLAVGAVQPANGQSTMIYTPTANALGLRIRLA
jgi:hypothetical protein